MKNFAIGLVRGMAAIYAAGLVLDLAGRGAFGVAVSDIAKRITRGYGQ